MNLFYTHPMSAPYEGVRETTSSLIEHRENAWKNVDIFCLETGDQHFFEGPSSPEDFYQTMIDAQRCLSKLQAHAKTLVTLDHIEQEQARALVDLEERLHTKRFQQRLLSLGEADQTTPRSVSQVLQNQHPAGTFSFFQGDRQSRLDHGALAERLRETPRSHILSLSDSHRTTADLFRAVRDAHWKYPPERTALLSFDHRTDTYDIPTQEPQKANVMRWLLEKKYIRALGVIGTQPIYSEDRLNNATFIEGAKLYDERGTRKRDRLEAALDDLFWQWHLSGVRNLYLSVDLDGLRIDQLGITSTDYSRERADWTELKRLAQAEPFLFDSKLPTEVSQKLWQSVRFALHHLEQEPKPYYGIPASWIIHAVRIAKMPPYEFSIGVRDNATGKTLVGDITEVHGLDHRRHGARIATALLDAIVKETVR